MLKLSRPELAVLGSISSDWRRTAPTQREAEHNGPGLAFVGLSREALVLAAGFGFVGLELKKGRVKFRAGLHASGLDWRYISDGASQR